MSGVRTTKVRRVAVVFALLVAAAVALGVVLLSRRVVSSTDDAALMRAFERETGLLLSVRGSKLSATSGTWRAEQIELRTARGSEPILRAAAATLQLDVTGLLHGQTHIEHAVLEGADLTLDLRTASAAPAGAPTLDTKRLFERLPAQLEARAARIHVRSDGAGSFALDGVDLTLDRHAVAMLGRLRSSPTGARLIMDSSRDGAAPVAFALDSAVSWEQALLELRDLRVTLAGSVLAGAARFATSHAFELTLSGDQVDVATLPVFALVAPNLEKSLAGKGHVDFHVQPTGVTMGLDLRNATVQALTLEHLRAKLTKSDASFVANDVYIERGSSTSAERWTAQTLTFKTLGTELRPVGAVHVENLDLQNALGVPGRASGEVELQAEASGAAAKITGELGVRARLDLSDVELAHQHFKGQLSAHGSLADAGLRAFVVDALDVSSEHAKLTARGKVSESGALDLVAQGTALWEGFDLSGTGTVGGTLSAPEISAHVVPKALSESAAKAGAAQADVIVLLSDKPSITGRVELNDYPLHALLPKLDHAGSTHGSISAHLEITRGRLDDLRSIEGSGEIRSLAVGYDELLFMSAAFPIVLREGRIELHGVTLADHSQHWTLDGAVGLDRVVALSASTELPLGPLLASVPYVGAVVGSLGVELQLAGKAEAISVTGRGDLRGVTIQVGPARARWRNLEGHVSLAAGALQFHEITGSFANGTLSLNGTVALTGLTATAVDLAVTGRQLSFEPQENFQFTLDADTALRWSRGESLPKLSGTVKLGHFLYARHVQLPEAVIAMGHAAPSVRAPALALDLHLEHAQPLLVRNDFLDVELGTSGAQPFRVVGVDTKIGVLGELSVLRGRALFRGAELTVRHGMIKFQSESRIAPALDLLADAKAKRRPGALVMFEAHGDANRFKLDLRCVPSDGSGAPPPFACTYDGDAMSCGQFDALTTLWACEK